MVQDGEVPFMVVDQVRLCDGEGDGAVLNHSVCMYSLSLSHTHTHTQQIYTAHNAPITHCQFSPNGVRVASVDTMGALRYNNVTSL